MGGGLFDKGSVQGPWNGFMSNIPEWNKGEREFWRDGTRKRRKITVRKKRDGGQNVNTSELFVQCRNSEP